MVHIWIRLYIYTSHVNIYFFNSAKILGLIGIFRKFWFCPSSPGATTFIPTKLTIDLKYGTHMDKFRNTSHVNIYFFNSAKILGLIGIFRKILILFDIIDKNSNPRSSFVEHFYHDFIFFGLQSAWWSRSAQTLSLLDPKWLDITSLKRH